MVADDVTYAVDVKLLQDDRYVGSYVYNWTPDANTITAGTIAHLYVIAKDVLVQTDENYQEAMQYAEEQSLYYPPYVT
jgi:cytochrome c-type biogenesis protein CcmE